MAQFIRCMITILIAILLLVISFISPQAIDYREPPTEQYSSEQEENEQAEYTSEELARSIDRDFPLFCYIIAHEDNNPEGWLGVACTIVNRMHDTKLFGKQKTLRDVIVAPAQFSSYHDDVEKNIVMDDFPDEVIEAARTALAGVDITEERLNEESERLGLDPTKYAKGGALYFYADPVKGYVGLSDKEMQARECIKVSVTIGGNRFYKHWG